MIYDAIDMWTKIGIVEICSGWLKKAGNVLDFKELCSRYNIFGKKIPAETEDADLWRLLAMIGVGIVVPIELKGGGYVLGVRQGWVIPLWVYNKLFWGNLMFHVEQMLEAHESAEILNLRKLVLKRAMELFNDQSIVASLPMPPNTDNLEEEIAKITKFSGAAGRFKELWRQRLRWQQERTQT